MDVEMSVGLEGMCKTKTRVHWKKSRPNGKWHLGAAYCESKCFETHVTRKQRETLKKKEDILDK